MKKILLAVLFSVILIGGFLIYQKRINEGGFNSSREGRPLSVVATTFPQYDWMRQIIGERSDIIKLTLLMDKGVDLHSFQPSVEDITKIAEADLFVYVGGESDAWVKNALKSAPNPNRRAISLMEVLGDRVKEEEVVEGMQRSNHDHHEHEGDELHNETSHDEHDSHDEEEQHAKEESHEPLDEHVWLSLKNAQLIVPQLAEALSTLDPEGKKVYEENAKRYDEELAVLNTEYSQAIEGAPRKTLVFADRFPFRYLVDDYGLKYYAPFVGCSTETEASFETIAFLAKKLDEVKAGQVVVLETSDGAIARTVIANSKGKGKSATVLSMDSMQSVKEEHLKEGVTYLSIMQKNLDALKKALK